MHPQPSTKSISGRSRIFARRRSRTGLTPESFTPPLLEGISARIGPIPHLLRGIRKFARDFLDLQAASITRDLTPELGTLQGTILDVGCGSQPYRHLLPDGAKYMGIDNSVGKTVFGYINPDTVVYEGNQWPVLDGSTDAILCTEVLEHVFDVNQFLSEARRCLRPGAPLIMTTPFSARYHFIPVDFWRFTPAALETMLGNAGFTDIQIFARGNPITVVCYKIITLLLQLTLGNRIWRGSKVLSVLLTAAILPVIALFALFAHVTIGIDWGDDCLGYTIFATKPSTGPSGGKRKAA